MKNLTATILLDERLNTFPLRLDTRQVYLLLPIQHWTEGSSQQNKAKQKKRHSSEERKKYISLFTAEKTICTENPTEKYITNEWVEESSRIQDQYKNQLYFYVLAIKKLKIGIKKASMTYNRI